MMSDAKRIEIEKKQRLALAVRQQQTASDPKNSVWVEASAGTGKTKVLSDRVLRLLLSDVEPSKILCLTYTKAAAVEMKSRIYERLSKWVALDENDLKQELYELDGNKNFATDELITKARTLFAKTLDAPLPMKIQTIHGFCEEILKRFPLEAGISPYFEVMDERASNEALERVMHHLLEKSENFEDDDACKAILFLTENVSEFNFTELLSSLAVKRNQLMQVFSKFKNKEDFLRNLAKKLHLNKETTQEKAISDFEKKLDRDLIKKYASILLEGSKTDIESGKILYANLACFNLSSYEKVFLTQEGKIKAKLATKELKTKYADLENWLFIEAQRVFDLKQTLKNIKLFEATKAIYIIAAQLIDAYQSYKHQNAKLDYEDLIIFARNLLEKSDTAAWVLYKLDGGLEHILIDEAQDTSPDQWAIIKALTDEFFAFHVNKERPRTVFAVGDRKQSIYGFQGAAPEKFDEMNRFYQQKIDGFKQVRLDVSFRSTAAVLQTVNDLFSLSEAQKGVVENEKVEHLPFRLGEGGLVEIWPLFENQKDSTDDVWYPPLERYTKPSALKKLALKIALKIKDMVKNGEILASKGRPVQYGDFMVLVQRRNAFMEEFVKACKNNDVEVSGVDKMKLGDQLVIEDLISLAKFLLLPSDDLSLAEVLKSPLYNLTDEDLFDLCYQRGEQTLWQRLNANQKYCQIAQNLSELLALSDYKRPFELFSAILIEFDGYKKFYARLGAEAKDPLDEFMNLTLDFEKDHVPNLQNFITWIESSETEVKRELEQNDADQVRIMTVHGSKGLQAPIVILADTIREVKTAKEGGLVFDDDILYFPLSAQDYNENCNIAHEKQVKKAYDEYRRLLYVAMTRAEDRLYITGYGSPKKEDKSWYGLCEKTLHEHGEPAENDVFVVKSAQILPSEPEKKKLSAKIEIKDTSFAYQKAPIEPVLSKPFSPSHIEEDDDTPISSPLENATHYYLRGRIIHKILELLLLSQDKISKKTLTENYLAAQTDIGQNLKADIKREIFALIDNNAFDFLFSPHAKAEVAVMGEVDGRIISGQIDRLVVMEDKVIIVDFKTNRPAAFSKDKVPLAYLKQMEIYQKLVEKIYPEKTVETFILWTNTLQLMKI